MHEYRSTVRGGGSVCDVSPPILTIYVRRRFLLNAKKHILSFIFVPAFLLGRVAGAAALGGLKISHDFKNRKKWKKAQNRAMLVVVPGAGVI